MQFLKTVYEEFQVKFYIKSTLAKCKLTNIQYIFRKFIVVKGTDLSNILPFRTKNI